MKVHKTNEKIALWMFRTGLTQQIVAEKMGITRQSFSYKMRDNIFTPKDLIKLSELGFSDN